jgi:hypothetical protein
MTPTLTPLSSLALFIALPGTLAYAQSTAGPRPADPPVSNPAIQRFLAENEPRFLEFTKKHGGSWLPMFDEHSHAPLSIVGSGIPLATRSIRSIDAARSIAQEFLKSESWLWGAPTDSLKLNYEAAAGPLFVFSWQQFHDGLEVLGGRVQIQIHQAGRIALVGTSALDIPADIRSQIRIDAGQAEAAVKQGKKLIFKDTVEATDLAIFGLRRHGAVEPRVVYVVNVHQPSVRVSERVLVDAENGEILEVSSNIHDANQVHGTVTGTAYLGLSPQSGTTLTGVPGVNVTITPQGGGSTTVVTDAAGAYSASLAPAGPYTSAVTLTGPNIHVIDAYGNDINVSAGAVADGSGGFVADLNANAATTEENLSQVTAAVLHYLVRDWTVSKLPGYAPAFPQQKVVVNIGSVCNAYFDTNDNSINFFHSGGGCVNTAYSTVIDHEFGHGVDHFFGYILSPSYSEGVADVVAMYHTGQPIVGQDFFGSGSAIRTGENSVTWPASGCNFEPHCVGETYMGFAWQARKKLIQSLGAGPGTAVAEAVVLGVLPTNPFSIPGAVQQSFLLDDDDGDLSNGTPHFADLSAAAAMKGFTPPVPTGLAMTHLAHPDTAGQTRDYPIFVDVTASPGFTVSSVKVDYSDNDGASWNTLTAAATAVPGRYKTQIPAHVAPAVIHYKITATNTAGGTLVSPAGDSAYRFAVGAKTQLLFEDFESGAAGWTHAAVYGPDEWQIGNPAGSPVAGSLLDPSSAYSGTNVAGIDLGLGGLDGVYEPNSDSYIESPPVQCTGYNNIRLRFRRWLGVEGSQYDYATISLRNGASGQLYLNPWQPEQVDTSWTLQDMNVANAANTANVQFRFELSSDGGLEFGGWNLDDVEVYNLASTPVGSFTLSVNNPLPPVGSTLVFQSAGDPGAYFEVYLSGNSGPVAVDGFGVAEVGADALFFYNANLDGSGQFALPLPLPNDPILSGLELDIAGFEMVPGGLPQLSNSVKIIIQ